MRVENILNGAGVFLLYAASLYGALLLLLFILQPRLLYYPNLPSRDITATPEDIRLSYEPVAIVTEDRIKLDGWFIPAQDARGVLLFFHGNAGNISHRLDSLKIFNDLRLSVLIFDYRGYGRSEGRPSEQGTYRDAEAAWRYLTEQRHVPPHDIVFFGRSLGAAVATHLASRHAPKALILESAFTSVPDFAAELYPFLPARWLARFRYNTEDYLRSVDCPVLVVHGRDDEIIPYAHGERLFAAAREPKRFLEIWGGHNEGFLLSGQHYVKGLDAFLTAYLGQ